MRIATYGRQRQRVGEIILPTLGWGKHRGRLYASRSSGRKPGPTLGGLWTERQREEKTAHVWPYEPLCALFRQRAAAMRTPTLLERVWASFWEFAEDERKSRRKPWRFYSAWAVTSARSAGGFRGRRLTLFRRERDLVDADFWKRTGKASSWGIFCDAHLGCQPFSGG